VSKRIVWKIFGAMLVGSVVFAVGAACAAQLRLDWMDNAAGTAIFNIERKTGTAGTYARIATTGVGITTYVDSTAPARTYSLRKQTHGELERSYHGADGALGSRSAEGRAH
jgi:hypothetical protein